MGLSISIKPREKNLKYPQGNKLYPFELVFNGSFLCKTLEEAHELKDKLMKMRVWNE